MIRHLFEDPDAMSEMEMVGRSVGKPDATKRIFELIMSIARKREVKANKTDE